MKLETAKGVRDFPPEEKIIRQEIVDTLKRVFERYGFSPLETPILERYEVLTAKFAAGEESDALKETFKLKDQGERKLGLRFDLTVPLSRFVSMNPSLKMPFKRYEIGRTYRDGPIKLGRYREFWQCDVDIVGSESMLAEVELIRLSLDVFKELGFDAYLEVNNRKLLNGILEYAGVTQEKRAPAIIVIDKLKKIGIKEVKEELVELGLYDESIEKLEKVLTIKGSNQDKIAKLKILIKNEIGMQGITELEQIFEYLSDDKDVVFNLTLARGLAYYTGPVFEGFLRDSKITSSICGGGRYDDLIGFYLEGRKQFPATGISFGLEPIIESIKLKRDKLNRSVAKVFVAPIKVIKQGLEIAQRLRAQGINTDVDIVGKGISKNLDYANKQGIPFVVIVGPRDLENKEVTVRNMSSGEESKIKIAEIDSFDFN